eukprot:scaffold6818_cov103-Isochrysis_galbana.AAC.2
MATAHAQLITADEKPMRVREEAQARASGRALLDALAGECDDTRHFTILLRASLATPLPFAVPPARWRWGWGLLSLRLLACLKRGPRGEAVHATAARRARSATIAGSPAAAGGETTRRNRPRMAAVISAEAAGRPRANSVVGADGGIAQGCADAGEIAGPVGSAGGSSAKRARSGSTTCVSAQRGPAAAARSSSAAHASHRSARSGPAAAVAGAVPPAVETRPRSGLSAASEPEESPRASNAPGRRASERVCSASCGGKSPAAAATAQPPPHMRARSSHASSRAPTASSSPSLGLRAPSLCVARAPSSPLPSAPWRAGVARTFLCASHAMVASMGDARHTIANRSPSTAHASTRSAAAPPPPASSAPSRSAAAGGAVRPRIACSVTGSASGVGHASARAASICARGTGSGCRQLRHKPARRSRTGRGGGWQLPAGRAELVARAVAGVAAAAGGRGVGALCRASGLRGRSTAAAAVIRAAIRWRSASHHCPRRTASIGGKPCALSWEEAAHASRAMESSSSPCTRQLRPVAAPAPLPTPPPLAVATSMSPGTTSKSEPPRPLLPQSPSSHSIKGASGPPQTGRGRTLGARGAGSSDPPAADATGRATPASASPPAAAPAAQPVAALAVSSVAAHVTARTSDDG